MINLPAKLYSLPLNLPVMRRVFGESEAGGGGGQSNPEIVSFGFVRATMRARGFGAILKRDSSLSIYFSAAFRKKYGFRKLRI